MKINPKIGKTIIDGLKLAYEIDSQVRIEWAEAKQPLVLGKICLVRSSSRSRFAHYFSIMYRDIHVGNLYFDNEAEIRLSEYVHVRVENHILYNQQLLYDLSLALNEIGLIFHHITSLDLSRDFTFNIVQRLNGLMKSKEIATILNGRWITDGKEILPRFSEHRSRSLWRSRYPELTFSQVRGHLKLKAYNKMAEINCKRKELNDANYKNYILNFYGNPRSLHRLEVSIDSVQLRRCIRHQSFDLLLSQPFLDELFAFSVSSILSFSSLSTNPKAKKRPRTPIPYDLILGSWSNITQLVSQAKKYKPKPFEYIKLDVCTEMLSKKNFCVEYETIDNIEKPILSIDEEWLNNEFF